MSKCKIDLRTVDECPFVNDTSVGCYRFIDQYPNANYSCECHPKSAAVQSRKD